MSKGRISARAVEPIPFGARVRVTKDRPPICFVAADSLDMAGVARRQWGVGDKRGYEPGETVDIQTEGEILCDFGAGVLSRVTLRRGKVAG